MAKGRRKKVVLRGPRGWAKQLLKEQREQKEKKSKNGK